MSDWKGEHLIKGVTVDGRTTRSTVVALPVEVRSRREKRVCEVPSCTNILYHGNTSGVCRAHNHGEFCHCPTCWRPE